MQDVSKLRAAEIFLSIKHVVWKGWFPLETWVLYTSLTMQFILLLMHLHRSWQRNHVSSFRVLWGLTYYFILFQLVTQCNAKYVECFSAQKDCNKEKNRNSSVVPCKITSLVWLLPSITFCTEFSRCYAWKDIATRKGKCNLLFNPSCLVFQYYPDETEQKEIVAVSARYTVQVKC